MLGFRLFRHALLMLVRNPLSAIAVSFGPLLIAYATRGVLLYLVSDSGSEAVFEITELLILGVGGFLFGWAAVAWHRYVLMEERPNGVLPAWRENAILRYVDATVRVGIIWLFVTAMLQMLLWLLSALGDGAFYWDIDLRESFWPDFLIGFVSGYIWLRLGLVLPAAALGFRMRLREAWGRTKSFRAALLIVQLCVSLLLLGMDWIASTPVGVLAYLAVQFWIATMVGLSVLTTLYGHIWEERPL